MKIVIVGGGTAGWMTASTLIKAYPEWDITLYESPDVPSVGVGESTTQFFRIWTNFLGLVDEEWMPACDATYKCSVRFHNFHKENDVPWQYPFGAPRKDTYPPDMWFYKQWKDNWPSDGLARDYYLAAECGDRAVARAGTDPFRQHRSGRDGESERAASLDSRYRRRPGLAAGLPGTSAQQALRQLESLSDGCQRTSLSPPCHTGNSTPENSYRWRSGTGTFPDAGGALLLASGLAV